MRCPSQRGHAVPGRIGRVVADSRRSRHRRIRRFSIRSTAPRHSPLARTAPKPARASIVAEDPSVGLLSAKCRTPPRRNLACRKETPPNEHRPARPRALMGRVGLDRDRPTPSVRQAKAPGRADPRAASSRILRATRRQETDKPLPRWRSTTTRMNRPRPVSFRPPGVLSRYRHDHGFGQQGPLFLPVLLTTRLSKANRTDQEVQPTAATVRRAKFVLAHVRTVQQPMIGRRVWQTTSIARHAKSSPARSTVAPPLRNAGSNSGPTPRRSDARKPAWRADQCSTSSTAERPAAMP